MAGRPPSKQLEVLDYLTKVQARQGGLPTPAEVAREFSIAYPTLQRILKRLADRGLLVFESRGTGKPPRFELLPRARGVPVVGVIPAGPLSEALEHPEGYLRLSGLHAHFGLFVQGDSMADLLQPGDLVVLRQGLPERSGLICAVRLESEATLKYLDWRGEVPKTLTLRAHNPRYQSVQAKAADVTVDGVYESALRGPIIKTLLEEPV